MKNSYELVEQQLQTLRFTSLFNRIYPFTTENIAGYIDYFDLENKSLLTVGSSSDQVINAVFRGCKDITLLDINPYIEEYFYLKKSAILTLKYEDFFNLLSFKGNYFSNKKVLEKNTFSKVIDNIENEESKEFWQQVAQNKKSKIKYKLFSIDVKRKYELKKANIYLNNPKNYEETKCKIKNFKPNFIVNDIYDYHLNKTYDNIFLSNIADYNDIHLTKMLFNQLKENLKTNGKMLVSYLYQTTKDSEFDQRYPKNYDLMNSLRLFRGSDIITFEGIEKRLLNKSEDSAIIYTKK